MKRDERHIFFQLKAGKEKAFEYFFKTYFEVLYQYAYQLVKSQMHAEEIVEDTFVNIWEKKEWIDLQGSPKSYLFRMVYNQCLNHLKHKKVGDKYKKFYLYHQSVADLPRSLDGYPLEKMIDREFQEEIEKSISKLPDQCRRIFVMSRLESKKNQEIAEILGISVNTVKTQLLRGLKSVRFDLKAFLVFIFLKK